MLNAKMINSAIASTSITKEVELKCFETTAHVKKFSRNDTIQFEQAVDMVSAMIFVGIVDQDGSRIFESVEQISSLPGKHTIELFNHVNDYNADTVKSEAKKS